MKVNLKLEVNLENAKEFYDSIKPDFSSKGRSKVEMNYEKNKLIFNINSEDFTSVRASINSILLKLRMLDNLRGESNDK
jgi:tRNA threonylcarbamoyladenosine modification (KEOPS) complex  Pcc1 subunit